MADDVENDDQWLYGENNEEEFENGEASNEVENEEKENEGEQEENAVNDTEPEEEQEEDTTVDTADAPEEAAQVNGVEKENVNEETEEKTSDKEEEDQENGDDELDDSDDDVNVVIGDFTASTVYPQQLNIKRGGISTAIVDKSKQVVQSGKFQVEEFEQIGTINGVAASDYNFESLEEKPWRKPGADITDYFNYGFNEDTWKAYCERQKRIRVNESGVGIVQLNSIGLPRQPVVINENSKYGNQSYGQPSTLKPLQNTAKPPEAPKVNMIQVMTADRREYSRKSNFPDMSVPPPTAYVESFPMPDYGFNPEPEPFYGGEYEPTQESQWMGGPVNPTGWQPSEIKTLTGPNSTSVPPNTMAPPPTIRNDRSSPPPPGFQRSNSKETDFDREKEKEIREREMRERERTENRSHSVKPRDYEREKSRRRERSRSRSRRHRTRSRSPSHRSHKKKKSRRHEDSD